MELEAEDARLLLDLGRPLWADVGDNVPLPDVAGLSEGNDSSLLGVVISHAHPDHYGLAGLTPESVPIFMGEATARILREASFFTSLGLERDPSALLADRQPLTIGPFTITPYLVDHSAFDAYALLVEAGGRRLFYSGDFRGHGRKAPSFAALLRKPPVGVDVLVLEGTRIGRPGEGDGLSEGEVERQCEELFAGTDGIVLATFSVQNIDRLVSIYKAAVHSGRELVLDLYGARVTIATGRSTIPQPGRFENVKVFVPASQRAKVIASGRFDLVNELRASRVFPEQLAERAARSVMVFRPSMARELEKARCLEGASALYSMWEGYLNEARPDPYLDFLDRHDIAHTRIHSSGHASVADLRRLAEALSPARIVPIHTDRPGVYRATFGSAEVHGDMQWWPV